MDSMMISKDEAFNDGSTEHEGVENVPTETDDDMERIFCQYCERPFTDFDKWKQHEEEEAFLFDSTKDNTDNSVQDNIISCQYCDKLFTDFNLWQMHEEEEAKSFKINEENYESEAPSVIFSCQYCGEEFTNNDEWRLHQQESCHEKSEVINQSPLQTQLSKDQPHLNSQNKIQSKQNEHFLLQETVSNDNLISFQPQKELYETRPFQSKDQNVPSQLLLLKSVVCTPLNSVKNNEEIKVAQEPLSLQLKHVTLTKIDEPAAKKVKTSSELLLEKNTANPMSNLHHCRDCPNTYDSKEALQRHGRFHRTGGAPHLLSEQQVVILTNYFEKFKSEGLTNQKLIEISKLTNINSHQYIQNWFNNKMSLAKKAGDKVQNPIELSKVLNSELPLNDNKMHNINFVKDPRITNRSKYSEEQQRILWSYFDNLLDNNYPTTKAICNEISNKISVDPKSISYWFKHQKESLRKKITKKPNSPPVDTEIQSQKDLIRAEKIKQHEALQSQIDLLLQQVEILQNDLDASKRTLDDSGVGDSFNNSINNDSSSLDQETTSMQPNKSDYIHPKEHMLNNQSGPTNPVQANTNVNVQPHLSPMEAQPNSPMQSLSNGPSPMQSLPNGPSPMQSLPNGPSPMQSLPNGPSPMQSIPIGPSHMQSLQNGPNPIQSLQNGPNPIQSLQNGPNPMQSLPSGPQLYGPMLAHPSGPMQALPIGPNPMQSLQNGSGPMQSLQNGPNPMQSFSSNSQPNVPNPLQSLQNGPNLMQALQNGPGPMQAHQNGPNPVQALSNGSNHVQSYPSGPMQVHPNGFNPNRFTLPYNQMMFNNPMMFNNFYGTTPGQNLLYGNNFNHMNSDGSLVKQEPHDGQYFPGAQHHQFPTMRNGYSLISKLKQEPDNSMAVQV